MYIIAHNGSSILGGGEIGTALLLQGLQGRGHRVRMLCRDRRMQDRLQAYGIPVEVLHIGGEVMVPHAVRLARSLRRHGPDALLLTTFKKVFLAGLGARLARVPLVVQRVVLSSDSPARGPLYRYALRHFVDVVALNAAAMRPSFLGAAPGSDPSRVTALRDGVRAPVRHSEPGALRKSLGIPPDAPVVGAVARLARQKRFDRLLRAVQALSPDVHCVIAGEGEETDALRRLADELGLAGRLHLIGFRSDVGDVLDALDVFVVSSDREGLANAMLEAMAFGVPVVSTGVSGAHEALDVPDGGIQPGLIVGYEVSELTAALRRMLSDDRLRAAMGSAARDRWEREFGWARFLDDWERLLMRGGTAAEFP